MLVLTSAIDTGIGYGMASAILGVVANYTDNGFLSERIRPSFYDSIFYGVTCNLSNRFIEYIGSDICEYAHLDRYKTIIVAISTICLQLLVSKNLSKLMNNIGVIIPNHYVFIMNMLFLASILEKRFETTVKSLNHRVWQTMTTNIDSRSNDEQYMLEYIDTNIENVFRRYMRKLGDIKSDFTFKVTLVAFYLSFRLSLIKIEDWCFSIHYPTLQAVSVLYTSLALVYLHRGVAQGILLPSSFLEYENQIEFVLEFFRNVNTR